MNAYLARLQHREENYHVVAPKKEVALPQTGKPVLQATKIEEAVERPGVLCPTGIRRRKGKREQICLPREIVTTHTTCT
jgi:hypothetical protein